MTPPLIRELISHGDTKITIASNLVKDAQALAAKAPQYLSAVFLDVKNQESLEKLINDHDAVISFVPPWMHTPIAHACLKKGRNMITSSYISPDMEKIHNDVKAKGLIFLNECGLDPGIDIMGTMKIVHEARNAGYKVVSYESYCGGLPVADQADNPLGYKFSWNPGAAIKASRNTAIFKKNGKKVVTDAPLKCVEDREDFSVSMKLEAYPNRDSLVFMDRFGMHDCETFVRGTLRFSGFSATISAFHDIGLTSDDPAGDDVKTLRCLLESRL
jgi:saccharopine dehydrogenase-like NADP-dependent oxidoreductase